MIERLLRKRKTVVAVCTKSDDSEPKATIVGKTFETLDDGEWQGALAESFAEMKRQACRRRLLPHLPALPKPARNRSATVMSNNRRCVGDTHLPGSRRTRRHLDSRLLSRICFRKGKLSQEELEMLFNA
jgi:hypothetical protein